MRMVNAAGVWELQDGRVHRLTPEGSKVPVVLDPTPTFTVTRHINDPRFGGIGCFGVHTARRNQFFPDPARVYDWTWDVTERMVAAENGGYGITSSFQENAATWVTLLSDGESHPEPIVRVERRYTTTKRTLTMKVTVLVAWDGTGSPLYFKEPKLVAHSLRGYRFLQLLDAKGGSLGPRRDLEQLAKPSVHTLQFRQPERAGFRFTGSKPPITVEFDRKGWDQWADEADKGEPLGDGAAYCLQGPPFGKLTRAWESAHWPGTSTGGVMFHAWEGGTGYPDCLCAFRPAVPGGRYSVSLKVEV